VFVSVPISTQSRKPSNQRASGTRYQFLRGFSHSVETLKTSHKRFGYQPDAFLTSSRTAQIAFFRVVINIAREQDTSSPGVQNIQKIQKSARDGGRIAVDSAQSLGGRTEIEYRIVRY
jgi:hypothetical protein